MAKVGVVLSGCGVYDGSEIHEAVITLLALSRAGADAICMAPNIDQMHVVNHLTGEVVADEKRNVLVESARIARGDVKDIATLTANDFDALIIPGGFGAAKNLCDFAVNGPECGVNSDVARLINEMVAAKKPFAALCIAPAVLAKILGNNTPPPQLTIGNDAGTAQAIEQMGAHHINCPVSDMVIDKNFNCVSTPAYMLAGSISEAAEGIEKTVQAVLNLI